MLSFGTLGFWFGIPLVITFALSAGIRGFGLLHAAGCMSPAIFLTIFLFVLEYVSPSDSSIDEYAYIAVAPSMGVLAGFILGRLVRSALTHKKEG